MFRKSSAELNNICVGLTGDTPALPSRFEGNVSGTRFKFLVDFKKCDRASEPFSRSEDTYNLLG
ncbi:MAG TPA: hypothetical protein V6D33_07460 [Cyanophyceae cyanobacterium]